MIAERPNISASKEQKLDNMRKELVLTSTDEAKLRLYDQLYQEYLVYRYDSAMVYAMKGYELAKHMGNQYYLDKFLISRTLINARGGFYSEAEDNIKMVSPEKLDSVLRYEYHITLFWLYLNMREYSDDPRAKDDYKQRMDSCLLKAIQYEKKNTVNWYYLMGEKAHYMDNDSEQSAVYYQKVVDMAPVNSKLYASAAFSLARCYMDKGDTDMYIAWLTNSAISDMITPLKENLSLQELAMYLFENDPKQVERATRYIYCSMEDAQFFNNRLRIIDISHKFPTILSAYTDQITDQKSRILYGLVGLGILAVAFLVALLFIKRQNSKLHQRRTELQNKNQELHEQHEEVRRKNAMLEEQGHQLNLLNERLIDTNFKREGLAKIYIDLCAKYIDKLKKYQTLVQRKIKANQVSELLSTISSSRISEEDAAIFLGKFDKAFLNLYPTFVQELNTLLAPDQQITVKQGDVLTTELRIYALIRLGVKESAEIADLLFYSPQTIYNYRSAVKNRAINK
ncbi:MAG: hypothetical protein J1E37_08260, partial [Prevotella sp.]|nr:hypothetical protein [Prevotella sp.]